MTSRPSLKMKAPVKTKRPTRKLRQKAQEEKRAVVPLTLTGGAPRMKVIKRNGEPQFIPDHPHEIEGLVLLMQSIGTTDLDFMSGILDQLVNADSSAPELRESKVNFILSVIKGAKPTDQIEAMLALQMAVLHMAAMTSARRLANVENILQQDSAERALNKLTRAFAIQTDAFKRYRSGGEQKVTVQYVSVNDGGQAVVTQNALDNKAKNTASLLPALGDAAAEPMHTIEDNRQAAAALTRKAHQK